MVRLACRDGTGRGRTGAACTPALTATCRNATSAQVRASITCGLTLMQLSAGRQRAVSSGCPYRVTVSAQDWPNMLCMPSGGGVKEPTRPESGSEVVQQRSCFSNVRVQGALA